MYRCPESLGAQPMKRPLGIYKKFWAVVVTQTKKYEDEKEFDKQQHERLAFLGEQFRITQTKWTTYEKELMQS